MRLQLKQHCKYSGTFLEKEVFHSRTSDFSHADPSNKVNGQRSQCHFSVFENLIILVYELYIFT